MIIAVILIILCFVVIGFSIVNIVYYAKIFNADTDTPNAAGVSRNDAIMMLVFNSFMIIISVVLIAILAWKFNEQNPPSPGGKGGPSGPIVGPGSASSCPSTSPSVKNVNWRDPLIGSFMKRQNKLKASSNLGKVIYLDNDPRITRENFSDENEKNKINNPTPGNKDVLEFLGIKDFDYCTDKLLMQWDPEYNIFYKNDMFMFDDKDDMLGGVKDAVSDVVMDKFLKHIYDNLKRKGDISKLKILLGQESKLILGSEVTSRDQIKNIFGRGFTKILCPYFSGGSGVGHWILFFIDFDQKTVMIQDSLSNKVNDEYIEKAVDLIALIEGSSEGWKYNEYDPSPNQESNTVDCGVFTIWNAIKHMLTIINKQDLANKIVLDEKTIIWYRTVIAKTMVTLRDFYIFYHLER